MLVVVNGVNNRKGGSMKLIIYQGNDRREIHDCKNVDIYFYNDDGKLLKMYKHNNTIEVYIIYEQQKRGKYES